MEVSATIRETLHEILEDDEFNLGDDRQLVADLGLDSLDLADLMSALERKLDLPYKKLNPAGWPRETTVGDLIRRVSAACDEGGDDVKLGAP
jgi:acyl carrier protein